MSGTSLRSRTFGSHLDFLERLHWNSAVCRDSRSRMDSNPDLPPRPRAQSPRSPAAGSNGRRLGLGTKESLKIQYPDR
jgi:hypothetical protein